MTTSIDKHRSNDFLYAYLVAFKTLGQQDLRQLKACPLNFFVLDGANSGISVSKVVAYSCYHHFHGCYHLHNHNDNLQVKYNPMRDFDISFWFRLNTYSCSASDPFDSVLLRLQCSNGCSMTINIIDPYVLQLICTSSVGIDQTFRSKRAVGSNRVLTNVWYHFRLLFTQGRKYSLFSTDDLTVSIDDTERLCIKV